eukprot:SAG31_NODE_570_length_14016_cov_10.573543_7_plen_98_part_00
MLSAVEGDGVIVGASSTEQVVLFCAHSLQNAYGSFTSVCLDTLQMLTNLATCLDGGPLPPAVVEEFERAWAITEGTCPPYYNGYSGQTILKEQFAKL